MTNKDIWDVLMEIYTSEHSKDTTLVISSIDDHFNCYFDHINGQLVFFKIKVNNSFFSDNTYEISSTMIIGSDGKTSKSITEKQLKVFLIPIIRQAKLDLLGI